MTTTLSKKLLQKLESYKADANQCTHIKFIYDETDINCDSDKNPIFKPEYTHQIFGDDELIFGFKNLTVNYYLTPGLMHAYVGLNYAEKITPQRFDGIEPDDVYDALQKFGCSPGFTRNLDLFCSDKLKQDLEFRPFGKKIHEYTTPNDFKKYEVYKVDLTDKHYADKKFVDYLQRVQTMLIFFIETADFTDTDDDQWVYYFLYEKRSGHGGGVNELYTTIGFTSVYNYYAYPDKKRTRISQMLIMPTHQKSGHGAQLMESIYTDALLSPEILDVTAEAPSVDFVKLRDYVTCCMCMQLESFKNADNLKKGFSADMVVEALRRFKLPKLQTRRCYEILRLKVTNQNNPSEYRDYRLDVKKRLFIPFIRNLKFARNGGSAMNPDEDKTCSSDLEKASEAQPNKKQLPDRFGFNAPTGTTTIGFGSAAETKPSLAGTSKTVRFSQQQTSIDARFGGPNKTSQQVGFKPNSSYEDDSDAESDEMASNTSLNPGSYGALFMNASERKIYLEKEFQEMLVDYGTTLKRLDNLKRN
jgi:histone acetyltransferase 1